MTYLCVDILKVCQPVLAVLWVADVIGGHKLITACRQENAVHKVGHCRRVILLVSLVPVSGDIIG